MIAIDTNVLLRYLLDDDHQQFLKAKAVINKNHPALITDVVLSEAIWTLSGKRYGYDKESICRIIRAVIDDSAFLFEDLQVIWSALCAYEESITVRGKTLDFADSLIVAKSHAIAQGKGKGKTLTAFYSFDKAVQQLEAARVPA